MNSRRLRAVRLPVSAVPLFALVLAGLGCGEGNAPAEARAAVPDGEVRIPRDSPKRVSLGIDTAKLVTERVIATLPAQVVPNEGRTVRVTSPVVGRIVSLDAQPGDRVRAGQPLARVRSADAAQATSDVTKALTAWTTARGTLARATDLYEHKIIAVRELEQARNEEGQAHAEYLRASARARQLGLGTAGVSDAFVLRAPMSGVVIDRSANPGAEVRPDNPQALFTISSLDTVWLSVSVPQRDVSQVHRGAKLRFRTEAVPGRIFDARVSFVSDALDPVSRTATVRAVLANPAGTLHVQTTGEVQLLVTDATPVIVIPTRALVTHGTDTVVFIEVSPGRFVRRTVTVRDDDGTMATISAGLTPGDHVVTTGSLLLAAEATRAK
jgi:cobalt-zinc-cadmium efflux system membrane fusion protein